jgi:hypothetical protein
LGLYFLDFALYGNFYATLFKAKDEFGGGKGTILPAIS